MGKLDSKVAIITGGGTGIGRVIALEFAKEGAAVAICGRTASSLEKVAAKINGQGGRCLAFTADVTVKAQVQKLVKQTLDRFGQIDILVNNAAIFRAASILETSERDWEETIDINLKGVFLCTQAVAAHMIERKTGKIINISSICGRGGELGCGAPYCASKAGVIALTQVTAWELSPHGINVNSIAPGLVVTEMSGLGKTKEEYQQFIDETKRASVLRRVGEPLNIARTALFLASGDASLISGQTIAVDGGRTNRT